MALSDNIKQQVANAFTNILGPGGLTETVTVRYYTAAGTYDVENDNFTPVYTDVPDVLAVVAKPTFDDVRKHDVVFTDAKLIIPGQFLVNDPEVETDRVVRANGDVWHIRKIVGVPGRGALIIYIFRN